MILGMLIWLVVQLFHLEKYEFVNGKDDIPYDFLGMFMILLVLNAGNGWDWGLLGWLLIVIMDHSLIPC